MEENKLIAQAQKGKTDALEELLRRYQGYIYAVALGILRTPADAEDAAQEVMLRICKSIPRFRLDSAFSTWIYRITINCCTDMLRAAGKKQLVPLESIGETPDDKTPEEILEQSRISTEMRKAIDKLGPDHKEIIILREMEHLSYEELVQKLHCTLPAVKSRLFRARMQLREICLEMKIL